MCGRYRLSRRKQLVQEYFETVSDEPDWAPRYNIAPTQPVAVIRQNPNKPIRELSLLRWGLIPSWMKDSSGAATMINARSETAGTKPADMTRHSFLLAADSSGRRGVSPQVYSDPVVRAARMFSKLSASWQSSLPDEFVGFQLVRDQATRRVEPARKSSPGCNPARAGILQTARYALRGVLLA